MKLLHFADSHLNAADHGNWTLRDESTKRSKRAEDFLSALDKVVDAAINERVDCVLFAGDAYDNESPDNYYRDRFQAAMGIISAAGIPVVMIPGNHDKNKKDTANSAVSVFESVQCKNIFAPHETTLLGPEHLGVDLFVIAVPWKIYKNVLKTSEEIRLETAAEIDAAIVAAQKQMGNKKYPVVLLSHGEIEGAVYNGKRLVNGLEGDMSFTMDTVADKRLTYTAFGHLHKFQNLNKGQQPPVVYSGSLERVDMSEARDDKGFVIVDINDQSLEATVELRSINPRKMFDIKVTPKVDVDINAAIEKALPSEKRLKDAIVKITVSCPMSRKDSIDREALAARLSDCFQIVGACPNMDYIHEQRVRLYDHKTMQSKTNDEILADYFNSKGKSDEDIKRLVELHGKLNKEKENSITALV